MQIEKTRNTLETQISLKLNLYGSANHKISTGIKFFDHMLEQLSAHSLMDIELNINSLDGDFHHVVEDSAITIGAAIKEALGDKKGITRYADTTLAMDEALVLSSLDISGRAYCKCDLDIKEEKTSDFETVLSAHFFQSLAQAGGFTLHIKMLDGRDPHHIIECAFKSFAHSLKKALKIDSLNSDKIPSTKGVL